MKKLFITLLSLVLSVSLLTACSSNDSSTNSEGKKLSKVELKVFIAQPRFKKQYEKYIDQFVAKQKEEGRDVTVKLEMPAENQSSQILKTRLASGDSPDVFSLHAINDIPVYDKAGYLEDLTNEPFVEKVFDNVISSVTTKDGRVVAVPLETIQWGYMYNKEIFNKYDIQVPQTLTEMKAVVKKLENNNVTPFLLTYKDTYIPQLFLPLTVGALDVTANQGFIDGMNEGKGSFADLKGMFDVMDLTNTHGTDRPFEVGADQGATDFANGKAAMWVQGPWMADSILATNENFEFGVAPLPINDDKNATLINLGVSTSLAVSKESKVKDVAKDFVNYIMDDEDSSGLYESLAFNPISDLHTFELYPWLQESQIYIEEGKSYQDPSIPSAVKSESEKLFQSYFAGDKSKEEVIKGLDNAWAQYLKVNK